MKRFLLSIILVMLAFSFRVSAENNVYNWTVDGSESQITAGIKYLALGDVVWGVDWHSAGQNDGKVKGSDCIVFGAYNNPLRNLTFSYLRPLQAKLLSASQYALTVPKKPQRLL